MSEFEKYCLERLIIPRCMPAHSSHLCQPLDLGCFSALKGSYGEGVAASIRLGVNRIDKQEFLSLYQTARVQALSSNNIRSGFKGALTAAEAAEAIQQSEGGRNEQGGVDEAGPSEPKRRAPSKCSICKSENHTARTCALR